MAGSTYIGSISPSFSLQGTKYAWILFIVAAALDMISPSLPETTTPNSSLSQSSTGATTATITVNRIESISTDDDYFNDSSCE